MKNINWKLNFGNVSLFGKRKVIIQDKHVKSGKCFPKIKQTLKYLEIKKNIFLRLNKRRKFLIRKGALVIKKFGGS